MLGLSLRNGSLQVLAFVLLCFAFLSLLSSAFHFVYSYCASNSPPPTPQMGMFWLTFCIRMYVGFFRHFVHVVWIAITRQTLSP